MCLIRNEIRQISARISKITWVSDPVLWKNWDLRTLFYEKNSNSPGLSLQIMYIFMTEAFSKVEKKLKSVQNIFWHLFDTFYYQNSIFRPAVANLTLFMTWPEIPYFFDTRGNLDTCALYEHEHVLVHSTIVLNGVLPGGINGTYEVG